MKMKKTSQIKILDLFESRGCLHSSQQRNNHRYNSIKSRAAQSITSKNKENSDNSQCVTDRSSQSYKIQDFQTLLSMKINQNGFQQQNHQQNGFNMQTFVRFRPFTLNEIRSSSCASIENITILNDQSVKVNSTKHRYDKIFTPECKDSEIYERCAQKLIESFWNGYNATIFAYGQTGSGKTYTMFGSGEGSKGIVPLAIQDIWNRLENQQSRFSTPNQNTLRDRDGQLSVRTFKRLKLPRLSCSMLQIYKENLYDLLSEDPSQNQSLKIKQTAKGFQVFGLSTLEVQSYAAIMKLIQKGNECKKIRQTHLNQMSSRSHLIFTVYLEIQINQNQLRRSKLHLIDLAGSQKVFKSKVQGEGLEQAKKINLSLSVLGNTINALIKGQQHIPFRESKLTKLLHQSLGGNSLTSLIVTCSMHESCAEETIGSLNFANRAKRIKNHPTPNITKLKEKAVDRFLYESLKHSLELKEDLLNKVRKEIEQFCKMWEGQKKIEKTMVTIEKIKKLMESEEIWSRSNQNQNQNEESNFVQSAERSFSNQNCFQRSFQNSEDEVVLSVFNPKVFQSNERQKDTKQKEKNCQLRESLREIKNNEKISDFDKIEKLSANLLKDIVKRQQERIQSLETTIQQQQKSIDASKRNSPKFFHNENVKLSKPIQNLKVKLRYKSSQEKQDCQYQTPVNLSKQKIPKKSQSEIDGNTDPLLVSIQQLRRCIETDKKDYYHFQRRVLQCQIEDLMGKLCCHQDKKREIYTFPTQKFVDKYIELLQGTIGKCFLFVRSFLLGAIPYDILKKESPFLKSQNFLRSAKVEHYQEQNNREKGHEISSFDRKSKQLPESCRIKPEQYIEEILLKESIIKEMRQKACQLETKFSQMGAVHQKTFIAIELLSQQNAYLREQVSFYEEFRREVSTANSD